MHLAVVFDVKSISNKFVQTSIYQKEILVNFEPFL